mgnify:CR=1 FL=1
MQNIDIEKAADNAALDNSHLQYAEVKNRKHISENSCSLRLGTSNGAAPTVNDIAKIEKNTQSAKKNIKSFFNGDFKEKLIGKAWRNVENWFRKLLKMNYKGQSNYNFYNTPKGVMDFRIANHNANPNNFKKHGGDVNISVYVALFELEFPTADVDYTEYRYSKEDYEAHTDEIINAIIRGFEHALNPTSFLIDCNYLYHNFLRFWNCKFVKYRL